MNNKIVCPYCHNNNQEYLYDIFDIIRDNNSEQKKLAQELSDMGYRIFGCDGCCRLFIVKDE